MADTVPDRPLLPADAGDRLPQRARVVSLDGNDADHLPEGARTVLLNGNLWHIALRAEWVRPRWQGIRRRTRNGKCAIDIDVEEERVGACAGKPEHHLEDVTGHRAR